MPRILKLTGAVAGALAISGAAYLIIPHANRLKAAWNDLRNQAVADPHESARSASTEHEAPPTQPTEWDGLVTVTRTEQKAIGFNIATVLPQTEPMLLELNGRTAYDPDTITRIRPRFDTRVEKVFASLGAKIRKGEPLVELYSTDLASAKTDFQTKFVQWQHDLKLLNIRQKLVQTGAISQQLWVDTQNDEQKSRLEFTIAQDKLTVFYEVPKEEIDPLLDRLGDQTVDFRSFGNVSDKAKMTMRAKTDGIVIAREVVPGNYYETTDVLMEIAPLDHLWVWINVFEVDQDKARLGQKMRIEFPFLSHTVVGEVDYVANEVSRETRAIKVRALIPNPDGRFKSDMLVKVSLEIPPVPGQTVIPRLSMVSTNGKEYVFVRRPSTAGSSDAPLTSDRFERRSIEVAQERSDFVVVGRGLLPGEEIVTNGSLILSQLHEDQKVTATGLPAD